MLKYVYQLRDLKVSDLYGVYSESLEKDRVLTYYDLDVNEGYLCVCQDFFQYLKQVFFSTEGACCVLYTIGDIYVSALRLEPYKDGLLISAVETMPEYRRKGYAAELLKGVIRYAGSHGVGKLYSHVEKRNIPSLLLHESCGFSRISESASYIDGTVSNRGCTFCYALMGLANSTGVISDG